MERIHTQYLFNPEINADKMIFLSGPRQIGKTTFVRQHLKKLKQESLYFNWDDPFVRREYIRNPHFLKGKITEHSSIPLIAFDEIHKHKNWKDILKGLYDLHRDEARFIITGSARLDYFRKSGDSLIGRYFSYGMLPLGLAEAMGCPELIFNDDTILSGGSENELLSNLHNVPLKLSQDTLQHLMIFGGFPEPFLKASKRFSTKWKRDYKSLLIYEDLRDLSRIQDMKGVEQLVLLLPERIASPLSINSLREDLNVNHRTVSGWLEGLKKVFLIFSIMPWSKHIAKAIKKENKVYFYDWTLVNNPGARFENMVAVSLLRMVYRWNEFGLGDFDLRYVRNHQGREVDFLIVKDRKPFALFEAKTSDNSLSNSGRYFKRYLNVPFYQLVENFNGLDVYPDNCYIISAARFLSVIG
ncbi:ATP-binding protein [Desulfobacula sp.]|uniref:ATP-binding protein n=1 Tax=Desulfobacula sp. TaxID=2593537 RepID=UPI0027153559|nr:ATP-binding protein [Desulfobacula sp.]